MLNKLRTKNTTSGKKGIFSEILILFFKQLATSIICLAIVLGMKHSGNNSLMSYAKSLGVALKFSPGWEETVKDTFMDFKNQNINHSEENLR